MKSLRLVRASLLATALFAPFYCLADEDTPGAKPGGEKPKEAAKETHTPSRVLIAREGDSFVEEIDGQRVLHLSGEPYAMGFAHGKMLAAECRECIDAFLRDFAYGRMHYTLEYLQEVWNKAKPFTAPELKEE